MLRIPTLTTEDYFKLEDFQNDFNYLEGLHNSLAELQKTDIEAIKKSHSLDFTTLLGLIASVSETAKRYSISGSDILDDTTKIQEFVSKTGNLYFPKGTYNLSQTIGIYSNTTITAHPEAIFIRKHAGAMFQTIVDTNTTRYNGQKNIVINGGRFIHSGSGTAQDVFTLLHGENIRFNNVIIEDTVGRAAINIVGCKDVKINSCIFRGYIKTNGNDVNIAIQINPASYQAYPVFYSAAMLYDGIASKNITVENCLFTKSETFPAPPIAIGQQYQLQLREYRHQNIKILNNTMDGSTEYSDTMAIKCISWENAVIQGNIINDYTYGIYLELADTVYNWYGDIVKDTTNYITSTNEDEIFIGCRNITIANNVINPSLVNTYRHAIWFNTAQTVIDSAGINSPKHRNVTITGNVLNIPVSSVKSFGIDMDTTENVVIVGNTFINNATADSIAVGCQDYCKQIIIGNNVYKNIKDVNVYYAKDNAETVKAKGKTVLWEGKVYLENAVINLARNMSDFDAIFVEFEFFGTQTQQMDFSTTTLQSFREFNLADATTSTSMNYFEARIRRLTDKSLTHIGNKMVLSSNNSISLNDPAYYVKSVYGMNY